MSRASRTTADGDHVAAARSASAAHLVGFASAESTMLWGLLAHFMLQSPEWVSWSFYLAGVALLILYWPAKRGETFELRP